VVRGWGAAEKRQALLSSAYDAIHTSGHAIANRNAIARDLNKDAVPTAQGARAWSQATVRALLMREGVH
jgi:hypothetical protein